MSDDSVIASKEFSKSWPDAAHYYEGDPYFDVFEWSPSPPGTADAPVTQVHLHAVTSLGRILFRFKGPGSIDTLIDALTKHREGVWGKR